MGDPGGRRLARRRAELLAEAARVARILRILASRAGFDPGEITKVEQELTRAEQNNLTRGFGRLEPRTRFKQKSGHPLHEEREANLLFADESGLPVPQTHIKGDCFAVGAVSMDEGQAATYKVNADRLKQAFFGRTNVTFHEPDMREREGIWGFDGDEERQLEFDAALDQLVQQTEFGVFGVGIRKMAFAKEFVETGADPYLPFDVYAIAIQLLLERYVDYLNSRGIPSTGRVTFESQGPKEDAIHQREYVETLLNGTQWVSEAAFRSYLAPGVTFTKKSGSDPMELADMLSRDLYESVKSGCTATPKRWAVLSRKVYRRGDMAMGKFGIKVFPDSDVRSLIEAHRTLVGAGD